MSPGESPLQEDKQKDSALNGTVYSIVPSLRLQASGFFFFFFFFFGAIFDTVQCVYCEQYGDKYLH